MKVKIVIDLTENELDFNAVAEAISEFIDAESIYPENDDGEEVDLEMSIVSIDQEAA